VRELTKQRAIRVSNNSILSTATLEDFKPVGSGRKLAFNFSHLGDEVDPPCTIELQTADSTSTHEKSTIASALKNKASYLDTKAHTNQQNPQLQRRTQLQLHSISLHKCFMKGH
jgi:hypothetical protein